MCIQCISPCRDVLEGANELRLMLCREKFQGTKKGTSVIAACGGLLHFQGIGTQRVTGARQLIITLDTRVCNVVMIVLHHVVDRLHESELRKTFQA